MSSENKENIPARSTRDAVQTAFRAVRRGDRSPWENPSSRKTMSWWELARERSERRRKLRILSEKVRRSRQERRFREIFGTKGSIHILEQREVRCTRRMTKKNT
jgi:hypothetical protein